MRNKWILLLALVIQLPSFAQNDTIIRHYTDTVYRPFRDSVTNVEQVPDSTLKQREVIVPTDSADRRGHYIEAHVGLGYGSLGYGLDGADNRTNGSFSGLLQLQYAYFFHPNWGVGAGLWFTNYTSIAHIGGDYTWNGQTDTDYETDYNHTSHVNAWRERETVHNLGIPVSLQFQMKKDHWKAGLFAAVGVAPAFSVSKKYKVTEGEIAHSGYYPKWNLTLNDVHEFGTKDYTGQPCAKGPLSIRTQVDFFADLGALIPLTKQIDLLLGGYVNVSMNEANSSQKHPIGWKDDTFTFMEDYTGAYALELAGKSHPWEAGVKIGIHWHYIAPEKHRTEDYFEYFTREERYVTYTERIDTLLIARADTTIVVPQPEPQPAPVVEKPKTVKAVAKEVERFNKVYFAFDSDRLTNKAKNYLNSIIDALNRVPEAEITLDGHASDEGEDEYNDRLSERRAKAVREYLANHGIDRNRIKTVGHGSSIPNDETEREARKRDRRVEIKVIVNENEK